MKRIINIKEAKELIKRYDSIKEEGLILHDIVKIVRNERGNCTLCTSIGEPYRVYYSKCEQCIYNSLSIKPLSHMCLKGNLQVTFYNIYTNNPVNTIWYKIRVKWIKYYIIKAYIHNIIYWIFKHF